ncbi:MAG: carbohydrate porin [Chitinophagaceae bacterium]
MLKHCSWGQEFDPHSFNPSLLPLLVNTGIYASVLQIFTCCGIVIRHLLIIFAAVIISPMIKQLLLFFLLVTVQSQAQLIKDTSMQKNWSLHIQTTVIPQYHFNFSAPYTGSNSLQPSEGIKTSFTNTYYIGRRLWHNAALYINPEIAGGEGLSKATGIAGFPNGETFRIGSAAPKLYLARAYIEQKISLSGNTEPLADDQNQLRENAPASYLSIRAGKFSLADFFDDNTYSHDPRTDFMNWSLMSAGAWDYPANTRGYTNGLVIELKKPLWALRTALVQVPETANGQTLDTKLSGAFGTVLEGEKKFITGKQSNIVVRLGGFYNKAQMGNYLQAIDNSIPLFTPPDITSTRRYSRDKKGFYLNTEYNRPNAGAFLRYSRNDGNNETWAFTEIDRSLTTGLSLNGTGWHKPGDKVGLAYAGNGIGRYHRAYLQLKGYGFIIGDGNLNYGTEHIIELFYSHLIAKLHLAISPDYQFVVHPAYNKDRGPVHIVALRMHFEM